MFSDLLSEIGTSGGAGVGVGEDQSLDERTRLRSKCGGCIRASRPTRHVCTGSRRGKNQLEERMQRRHIQPPDQMMQMKVDEEHRVMPLQGDALAQGRRLQKFGGSAAIVKASSSWRLEADLGGRIPHCGIHDDDPGIRKEVK